MVVPPSAANLPKKASQIFQKLSQVHQKQPQIFQKANWARSSATAGARVIDACGRYAREDAL